MGAATPANRAWFPGLVIHTVLAHATYNGVREHGVDDEAWEPGPVRWSCRAHPSAGAVVDGGIALQGRQHRGGDEALDVPAVRVDFLDE